MFLHAELHIIANTIFLKNSFCAGNRHWWFILGSQRKQCDWLQKDCGGFLHKKNLFSLGNYLGNSDFYSLSPFPSSEKQQPNVNLLFHFCIYLTPILLCWRLNNSQGFERKQNLFLFHNFYHLKDSCTNKTCTSKVAMGILIYFDMLFFGVQQLD